MVYLSKKILRHDLWKTDCFLCVLSSSRLIKGPTTSRPDHVACVHRPDVGEPAARLPLCRSSSQVGQQAGHPLEPVEEDTWEDIQEWGRLYDKKRVGCKNFSVFSSSASITSVFAGTKSICESVFLYSIWSHALFLCVFASRWRMCAAGNCGRRTWCSSPCTTWRPPWGSTPTSWAWTTWETWWGTRSFYSFVQKSKYFMLVLIHDLFMNDHGINNAGRLAEYRPTYTHTNLTAVFYIYILKCRHDSR